MWCNRYLTKTLQVFLSLSAGCEANTSVCWAPDRLHQDHHGAVRNRLLSCGIVFVITTPLIGGTLMWDLVGPEVCARALHTGCLLKCWKIPVYARLQIHGDNAVSTTHGQHVCHQFSWYGSSALVLLGLMDVEETGELWVRWSCRHLSWSATPSDCCWFHCSRSGWCTYAGQIHFMKWYKGDSWSEQ